MIRKLVIVFVMLLAVLAFASCDGEAPTASLDSNGGFEEIHVEKIEVKEICYS